MFDPVPGRGFIGLKPPVELQVALPTEARGDRQLTALQELGRKMSLAWKGRRPAPVRLLGAQVALGDVLAADTLERWPINAGARAVIGLDDQTLAPVELDLVRRGPFILVSGAPEGGKTTALVTISLALASGNEPDRVRLAFIAPNRSERVHLGALAGLPHTTAFARTEKEIEALVEALEARLTTAEGAGPSRESIVLLIDDAHLLANRLSSAATARLETLIRRGADLSLTTIVSAQGSALGGTGDTILRQFKAARMGLWLKSTDSTDASVAGLRMPSALRGKQLPAGRGVLFGPSDAVVLQVATPEAGSERPSMPRGIEGWVDAIREEAGRKANR
jgi:hypothetical protein